MALSKDVETAKALAEKLHAGQVDKSGKPYIDHPRRVASRLDTLEEKVVGWLHDTVEDTGLSLAEVERIFGRETAWAVDAITHREDEPWERYLMRVKENPIARQVKISDLIDNSNLSRLPTIMMRDVKRQAKYNAALQYLMTDE